MINTLWYVDALSKYNLFGSIVGRFLVGTRFIFVGTLWVGGIPLSAAAGTAYPCAPFSPRFKTVAFDGVARPG